MKFPRTALTSGGEAYRIRPIQPDDKPARRRIEDEADDAAPVAGKKKDAPKKDEGAEGEGEKKDEGGENKDAEKKDAPKKEEGGGE